MGGQKKGNNGANLGKALIRNRFKTQQGVNGARFKVNPDGSMVKHTTEDEDGKRFKMQSVTQENDLEAFLSSATLAGTEFTAEKLNIQIIPKGYKNPFLLDASQEAAALAKHQENKDSLTVPRRPVWDGVATPEEQQRREREAFLSWRRSLVILEEEKGLLMTPYERNIEVWRQLWRVIERSDVVVQIVDARNPLLFRSSDLETYVKELDSRKHTVLLINKADMLTAPQRKAWADHLEKEGITFVFFSAALAKKRKAEEEQALLQQQMEEEMGRKEALVAEELKRMGLTSNQRGGKRVGKRPSRFEMVEDLEQFDDGEDVEVEGEVIEDDDDAEEVDDEEVEDEDDDDGEGEVEGEKVEVDEGEEEIPDVEELEAEEETATDESLGGMVIHNAWRRGKVEVDDEERIKILTCEELIAHLHEICPNPLRPTEKKITIGFVGYPNVGKSSTMNALVGSTKVTVSSTPGKTKHFQTIHLDDRVILCDCPGLVFPSFATTKAEMVINGILPIDQLREHTGPSTLVAMRIPRHALEAIYGIDILTFDIEGRPDPSKTPSGEDLCQAYAVARGFKKSVQGNPDEARAARIILKDYVRGKLLYCIPPPNTEPTEFNRDTYAGPQYQRHAKRGGPQTHEVAGEDGTLMTGDHRRRQQAWTTAADEDDAEAATAIDAAFRAAKTSGAHIKGVHGSSVSDYTRARMYPHQISVTATGGSARAAAAKGKGKAGAAPVPAVPGLAPAVLEGAMSKKHKKGKRAKDRVWESPFYPPPPTHPPPTFHIFIALFIVGLVGYLIWEAAVARAATQRAEAEAEESRVSAAKARTEIRKYRNLAEDCKVEAVVAKQKAELSERLAEESRKKAAAADKRADDTIAKLEASERAAKVEKANHAAALKEADDLERKLKAAESEKKSLRTAIGKSEDEKRALAEALRKGEAEKEAVQQALEEVRAETAAACEDKKKLGNALATEKAKGPGQHVLKWESALAAAQQRAEEAESKVKTLETALQAIQMEMSDSEAKIKNLESEIAELKEHAKAKDVKVKSLEAELRAVRQQMSEFEAQTKNLQSQIAELQEKSNSKDITIAELKKSLAAAQVKEKKEANEESKKMAFDAKTAPEQAKKPEELSSESTYNDKNANENSSKTEIAVKTLQELDVAKKQVPINNTFAKPQMPKRFVTFKSDNWFTVFRAKALERNYKGKLDAAREELLTSCQQSATASELERTSTAEKDRIRAEKAEAQVKKLQRDYNLVAAKDRADINRKISLLEEALDAANKRASAADAQVEEAKKECASMREEASSTRRRIEELQTELARISQLKEEAAAKNHAAEETIKGFQASADASAQSLGEATKTRERLEAELSMLREKLAASERAMAERHEESRRAVERAQAAEADSARCRAEMDKIKAEVQMLTSSLASAPGPQSTIPTQPKVTMSIAAAPAAEPTTTTLGLVAESQKVVGTASDMEIDGGCKAFSFSKPFVPTSRPLGAASFMKTSTVSDGMDVDVLKDSKSGKPVSNPPTGRSAVLPSPGASPPCEQREQPKNGGHALGSTGNAVVFPKPDKFLVTPKPTVVPSPSNGFIGQNIAQVPASTDKVAASSSSVSVPAKTEPKSRPSRGSGPRVSIKEKTMSAINVKAPVRLSLDELENLMATRPTFGGRAPTH
ncbi:hypothetical protein HDU96_000954 [Phlyctochytrium bullatum]|nr:hypothetical protein HDU96_000954 [Phlyctochytrium bullatum]